MKISFKNDLFLKQMKKAMFLYNHGIETVIEDEQLKSNSIDDYFKSLILLNENKLISIREYSEGFKEGHRQIYKQRLRKEIQKEKYNYKANENSVIMYCQNKYFLIKKTSEESFPNYCIIAKDSNSDRVDLNVREIPFLIKKDFPIYDIIDIFYKNGKNKKMLSHGNSKRQNYIEIEQNEDDDYILTVQKVKSDNKESDEKKAIINIKHAADQKYFAIDCLFERLLLASRIKDNQDKINIKKKKHI